MAHDSDDKSKKADDRKEKKTYHFGEIKAFDIDAFEEEILLDDLYLDVFAGSDPAFKTDVEKLQAEDVKESLKLLNAYSFKYDTTKFKDKNFPEGSRIGLMADEVVKAFPQCVKTDEEGHQYVNYSMLVAPLVETVKDLMAKVEELEKEITKLKK